MLSEKFMSFLWRNRLFLQEDLKTTCGKDLKIIHVGNLNSDAGPDYFNSRILIDGVEWAGNVELHLQSSDWFKHKHHEDEMYDSVILHVVLDFDSPVFRKNGEVIPAVALSYEEKYSEKYFALMQSEAWIPCNGNMGTMDEIHIYQFQARVLIERLNERTKHILEKLSKNKGDWEQTAHEWLCRYFGAPLNSQPFEILATFLPYYTLKKCGKDFFMLESLLFGVAGFLDSIECVGSYPEALKKEFDYQRKKLKLKTLSAISWKLMRQRPAGFPTIRLSQLAGFYMQTTHLFRWIIETDPGQELYSLNQICASGYWNDHYLFGKKSKQSEKKYLGAEFINRLIINVLIPLKFAHAYSLGRHNEMEETMELLEKIKPETNGIIKNWRKSGIYPKNAFQTQALLHLYKNYCKSFRCLDCHLGLRHITEA